MYELIYIYILNFWFHFINNSTYFICVFKSSLIQYREYNFFYFLNIIYIYMYFI